MRLDLTDEQRLAWTEALEAHGFPPTEARAYVDARCGDREVELDRDAQLRLAVDRFNEAQRTHLLMFGPPEVIEDPDGAILKEMSESLDPA